MKTKNLIIGVLAVAVIALGVLLFQEKNKKCPGDNSSSQNRSATCQFSPSDSCCVHVTSRLEDIYIEGAECIDSTEYGKGFGEESVDYIRKLIKDAKLRNVYNQIYGYQISMEYLKEMYEAIDEFDSMRYKDKGGRILTVAGVRFYEAVSERYINGEKRRKADLVMIPFLSSGEDVFKVDDQSLRGIFKMYTHFRPCPKLCGSKEKYIYEE